MGTPTPLRFARRTAAPARTGPPRRGGGTGVASLLSAPASGPTRRPARREHPFEVAPPNRLWKTPGTCGTNGGGHIRKASAEKGASAERDGGGDGAAAGQERGADHPNDELLPTRSSSRTPRRRRRQHDQPATTARASRSPSRRCAISRWRGRNRGRNRRNRSNCTPEKQGSAEQAEVAAQPCLLLERIFSISPGQTRCPGTARRRRIAAAR